jgi:hypothetical protein
MKKTIQSTDLNLLSVSEMKKIFGGADDGSIQIVVEGRIVTIHVPRQRSTYLP